MIKRGRNDSTLRTHPELLPFWCTSYGVELRDCTVAKTSTDRNGVGLVATKDLTGDEESPIIKVPARCVLSRDTVVERSKTNEDLWQILEAAGTFVDLPRNAIMVYLLYLIGNSISPTEHTSSSNEFIQYFRYISIPSLPTNWTQEERAELNGTSLQAPLEAKMERLSLEFDYLRTRTKDIPFCKMWWWHNGGQLVKFEDWVTLDAVYRSRALELPYHGHSMVMVIDMVNHSYGDSFGEDHLAMYGAKDAKDHLSSPTANARWDVDGENNAVLYIRDESSVKKGEEITISYGEEKSASEFLFTYGFVPWDIGTAKAIVLPYEADFDDSTTKPKLDIFDSRPMTRLTVDSDGHVTWANRFIWLLGPVEQHGLEVNIDDDEEQVTVSWRGLPLEDLSNFEEILKCDPRYEVHRYCAMNRLVPILKGHVEEVATNLEAAHEARIADLEKGNPKQESGSTQVSISMFYRKLEYEMLRRAVSSVRREMMDLMMVPIVREFLMKHPENMESLGIYDLLQLNKNQVVSEQHIILLAERLENMHNIDDQEPLQLVFPEGIRRRQTGQSSESTPSRAVADESTRSRGSQDDACAG